MLSERLGPQERQEIGLTQQRMNEQIVSLYGHMDDRRKPWPVGLYRCVLVRGSDVGEHLDPSSRCCARRR